MTFHRRWLGLLSTAAIVSWGIIILLPIFQILWKGCCITQIFNLSFPLIASGTSAVHIFGWTISRICGTTCSIRIGVKAFGCQLMSHGKIFSPVKT